MKLLNLNSPMLIRHLEATRVTLKRVSKTALEWSADRNLAPEERQALASRNDAVLDVLAARNLKNVNGRGSDVVPALRATFLDYGEEVNRKPGRLAEALYSHGCLQRLAAEKNIVSALEALTIEGRSAK